MILSQLFLIIYTGCAVDSVTVLFHKTLVVIFWYGNPYATTGRLDTVVMGYGHAFNLGCIHIVVIYAHLQWRSKLDL